MTDLKPTLAPLAAKDTPRAGAVAPTLSPGAKLWALVVEATPVKGSAALLPATQTQLRHSLLQNIQRLLAQPFLQAQAAPPTQARATASPPPSAHIPLAAPPAALAQRELQLLDQLLSAPRLQLIQAQIGKQLVPLLTDQALVKGQQIQVHVGHNGLQLVQQSGPKGAPATAPTSIQLGDNPPPAASARATQAHLPETARAALTQALRQALPLQAPAARLLPLLAGAGARAAPTPAIDTLLATALTLPPSSQSLKQAIASTGLFAESTLARATAAAATEAELTRAAVNTDAKLGLWQLLATPTAQASRPAAGSPLFVQLMQLLGLVEAQPRADRAPKQALLKELGQQWLAKIVTQQLSQLLEERPAGETRLNLELPARNDQQWLTVNLQFSKYWHAPEEPEHHSPTPTSPTTEPVWQVTLSLHIAKLGQLDARIRVIQDVLHCSLWAEQRDTLALITAEAARLTEAIRARGLRVNPIQCHAGLLPAPSNQLSGPLLDTHA